MFLFGCATNEVAQEEQIADPNNASELMTLPSTPGSAQAIAEGQKLTATSWNDCATGTLSLVEDIRLCQTGRSCEIQIEKEFDSCNNFRAPWRGEMHFRERRTVKNLRLKRKFLEKECPKRFEKIPTVCRTL